MYSVKKIGPWLLRRSHPLEGTNISTLNAHLNAEIISFPHFPISPFSFPFSFPSPFALLLSLSPFSFLFSLSPFSFLLSPSPFPFPFHFLLSPFSFPSPFAVPFLLSLPSSPLLIFSSSPLLLFFSFLLSPFPFPFPFPSPFPFLLSPFSFLFSPFLLSILLSLSLYKWNAGVTYRWRNPKLWFSLKKWTPDLNTVFKLT